jgi:dipeptidyl-peptidase 4
MIERVVIDGGRSRARASFRRWIPGTSCRRREAGCPTGRALCDHIVCGGGGWADVQWSPTASEPGVRVLLARSQARGPADCRRRHRPVRDVLARAAETFFESGQGRVNWRYLARSERGAVVLAADDWGHLYLHDAPTGCRSIASRGRGQRHPGAARGRRGPRDLLPGSREGSRPAIRTSATSTRSTSTARAKTLLTPEDADHTSICLRPAGSSWMPTRRRTCRP